MKWPFAIDCKDAFLHLFFPHVCAGCASDLLDEQSLICTACMRSLPFTEFEKIENNPVEKLFWGRTKIQHASSIFTISQTALCKKSSITSNTKTIPRWEYTWEKSWGCN